MNGYANPQRIVLCWCVAWHFDYSLCLVHFNLADMTTIQTACDKCGVAIEIIPIGQCMRGLCDECTDKATAHHAAAVDCARSRIKWEKIAANFRAYWNTDFYRLPYPEKTQIALRWGYGKRGLNLWGPPKCGKTRTLVMIAQQLYEDGKRIRMFGPADFAIKLKEKGWDAPAWLNILRCYDALIFDDVGKAHLSPVAEGQWFGLLEYFIGVGKPVLMTHNFSGDELEKKFRHGEAIVARIREHFQSVYFGEKV